jgi:hypothetical protein
MIGSTVEVAIKVFKDIGIEVAVDIMRPEEETVVPTKDAVEDVVVVFVVVALVGAVVVDNRPHQMMGYTYPMRY